MSVTLAQLKQRSRVRADMEKSKFVKDPELTDYINSSIAELHDILVQSYGSDYFVKSTTFLTVQDQQDYPLPDDFFKLKGVDVKLDNSRFTTIERFNFNERNRYELSGVWDLRGIGSIRYRLLGSIIKFTPTPDRNVPVKVWYTPRAVELVNDTDILEDFNQWHEYIIVDVAIKMLLKEESDTTALERQRQRLMDRIEKISQNRDAGKPESISDIYAEGVEEYFYGDDY